MKKALILGVYFLVLLAVSVSSGFGAEKAEKEWWIKLKTKVDKLVSVAPAETTTVAGGVRGAKEGGESPLYWKGKRKVITITELEDFNAALDLVMAGKNPEAIAKFEEFLNKYSSSALAFDAQESLKILKRE